MSYIVQLYHNNTLVEQIEEIWQKINKLREQNNSSLQKYFELKYKLTEVVSYGMTKEYGKKITRLSHKDTKVETNMYIQHWKHWNKNKKCKDEWTECYLNNK